jgi:hypothetical protein
VTLADNLPSQRGRVLLNNSNKMLRVSRKGYQNDVCLHQSQAMLCVRLGGVCRIGIRNRREKKRKPWVGRPFYRSGRGSNLRAQVSVEKEEEKKTGLYGHVSRGSQWEGPRATMSQMRSDRVTPGGVPILPFWQRCQSLLIAPNSVCVCSGLCC